MAASTANSSSSRTMSPTQSKKSIPVVTKTEDTPTKSDSEKPPTTSAEETSPDTKPAASNAPLAPPPRPAPATTGDTPDYFNTVHNPFSLEPNVFEQSFGNQGVETPGRTILPPVANITSPAPLPGITPGWQSLSESFRGFPTPNESSLRTGLTPGGGGSMFPAPSPNTQALLTFQSGVATPSTAEFQQSALRAAQQAKPPTFPTTSAPTSQPEASTAGMDRNNNFQQQGQQRNDPFNHDVSNAANDLLSFATQNGASRNGAQQQYSMPNPPQQNNGGHMPVQPVAQENGRRNTKGSINSISGSAGTAEFSDSGQSEQKATTRSRAKKGGANGKQTAGTKRKAEEAPKGGNKKKNNNSISMSLDGMEDDSEDENQHEGENGKKMTDEEKRKNFLERNRVAALKCRQRKKQWLANLQAKVELFSTENDALSATVTQLREEIVNLKTLLLAHKDCPVSHAQGLNGMNMNSFLGGEPAHQNPYGIAQMPNGVQMGMPMQPGTQMQNR